MECLKDCCKKLTKKRAKEQEETKGVAVQVPVTPKRLGVQEDYLLSKMPPDGKEVPFVLPTLKASYVQPGAASSPNLQYGMPGPTRCAYSQRKAELLNPLATSFAYSSESSLHTVAVTADPERTSFGLNSRDFELNTSYSDSGERLSRSMNELITTLSPEMKSFDSMSSVLSTPASIGDSMRSSADSFSLLGDDLGRLCVRLSYKEEMEQVWITLVQCSQLNLPVNIAQKPKIRIKGVITLPKPVKFQTSIKEYCQDTSFMETFVFALSLQSLRGSALLLKLQTQGAKKRTVAKCVLSLRPLGPQEIEQWQPLRSPCKFSVRSRMRAASGNLLPARLQTLASPSPRRPKPANFRFAPPASLRSDCGDAGLRRASDQEEDASAQGHQGTVSMERHLSLGTGPFGTGRMRAVNQTLQLQLGQKEAVCRTGPAGIERPHPGSGGAVEGHRGPSRESGGSLAYCDLKSPSLFFGGTCEMRNVAVVLLIVLITS